MILVHRYPHGIRGVAGFAYGMSRLPWSTFLALNFVAAGLWSCAVVSAGYAFGQVSEKLMNDASSGLGFVMLVAFLGLSWLLSKKLEDRVAERRSEASRTRRSQYPSWPYGDDARSTPTRKSQSVPDRTGARAGGVAMAIFAAE